MHTVGRLGGTMGGVPGGSVVWNPLPEKSSSTTRIFVSYTFHPSAYAPYTLGVTMLSVNTTDVQIASSKDRHPEGQTGAVNQASGPRLPSPNASHGSKPLGLPHHSSVGVGRVLWLLHPIGLHHLPGPLCPGTPLLPLHLPTAKHS